MNRTLIRLALAALSGLLFFQSPAWCQKGPYRCIVLRRDAPPALRSAARILARELGLPASAIRHESKPGLPASGCLVLDQGSPSAAELRYLGQNPGTVAQDGYLIRFRNAGALVFGKRPRSLLYAAGDLPHWRFRRSGIYLRQPEFRIRDINLGSDSSVADLLARTGANLVFQNISPDFVSLKALPKVYGQLDPAERRLLDLRREEVLRRVARIRRACHKADVPFYPFLYGNDLMRWSPILASAVYRAYPHIAGQRAPHSWEKASLNPALPETWTLIRAIVREYMQTLKGDGLVCTFWDAYGLYSQDSLSRARGLNRFDRELYLNVGAYQQVLSALHKPLIVRTWSSGRAHWVVLLNNDHQRENQFVHAPGYGYLSGSKPGLWHLVIDSLPASIILQTKAYQSDCFPAARDNALLGKTGAHPQIIEYQMTGQTTGLYYTPAVNLAYTDSTLRRFHRLAGGRGGTNLFYGATGQTHYNLFSDLANSINVYGWKELSWNLREPLDSIWEHWALPRFGPRAAPYLIDALRRSERAANGVFSTLGFGWDTNSHFPASVDRREVLLTYTNRFYLPAYQRYLRPNRRNIRRVRDQKDRALAQIDTMQQDLKAARPFLSASLYGEFRTRFGWLRKLALVNRELETGYWTLRYLRYLHSMRLTDTAWLRPLLASYQRVQQLSGTLFRYAPDQKFSGYSVAMGTLARGQRIGLGSPMPLMRDILERCWYYEQDIYGPELPLSLPEGMYPQLPHS